jgi:hypothetical protein
MKRVTTTYARGQAGDTATVRAVSRAARSLTSTKRAGRTRLGGPPGTGVRGGPEPAAITLETFGRLIPEA